MGGADGRGGDQWAWDGRRVPGGEGPLLAQVGGGHTVGRRQRTLRVCGRQVPVAVHVGGLCGREVVGGEVTGRDTGDDGRAGAGGSRQVGGTWVVGWRGGGVGGWGVVGGGRRATLGAHIQGHVVVHEGGGVVGVGVQRRGRRRVHHVDLVLAGTSSLRAATHKTSNISQDTHTLTFMREKP